MPTSDELRNRITTSPDVCNGRPVIKGSRITVATVLDFLAAGDSPADILAAYPRLKLNDIRACLAFARDLTDNRLSMQAAE